MRKQRLYRFKQSRKLWLAFDLQQRHSQESIITKQNKHEPSLLTRYHTRYYITKTHEETSFHAESFTTKTTTATSYIFLPRNTLLCAQPCPRTLEKQDNEANPSRHASSHHAIVDFLRDRLAFLLQRLQLRIPGCQLLPPCGGQANDGCLLAALLFSGDRGNSDRGDSDTGNSDSVNGDKSNSD